MVDKRSPANVCLRYSWHFLAGRRLLFCFGRSTVCVDTPWNW